MSLDISLPLSFRADLLTRIMPLLHAGECCSLIGVSGMGKSNLVHFLRRHDVQQHYWQTDQSWIILVDAHSLIPGDQSVETVTLELMIHRLILEAERHAFPADFTAWANELHARLMTQPSPQLGMRYLERICMQLCERYHIQLIFLFDQFENLWNTADAYFFRNLRYLRDLFKYRVVYAVFSRQSLHTSREDRDSVEAFWELFSSHVYSLRMHPPGDAMIVLQRLMQRAEVALEEHTRQHIVDLCGGHPGLIRSVFWTLVRNPNQTLEARALLDVSAVAEECRKIWNALHADEQHGMYALVAGEAPETLDSHILELLQLKGVLTAADQRPFAPLFMRFVRRQVGIEAQGVIVNARLRQVWIDGQAIDKSLSRLEFNLLEYLARHGETVCRREDILQALYGDEVYEANDERLDTIVRRLRESLKEDARNPRYLVTHRGVGLQLLNSVLHE
jgi:DNA-binding winged helix-turn-helix (wHTH) protein